MQKWEYLVVIVSDEKMRPGVLYVNGMAASEWESKLFGFAKATPVYTWLNKVGEEGWEVVTSSSVGLLHNLILKRPKE